jgi:ketosteroid isomerase-like protein
MSEENVEIVRRAFAYEVYGVGDRAEAEAIFDPNVVMNPTEEGPSYGLDAIRDNFERWASAWEDLQVTAEEFLDAGDRVLVTEHHRGRGRGSGIEVDTRLYSVYTVCDGKVVRMDQFTDRPEALEAAGLSE